METFAGASIEVAEVVLKEGSPVVGCAVRDVRLPGRSLIVGVVRGGEALVPKGNTVLEARDHVFLICERQDVSEVVGAVAADTSPVRNVMILGGGRIGLLLALSLEEIGIAVKVIERDAARARYVASRLRKGLALHDEGVSREFLLQERVDRADAFVAVNGDDRTKRLAARNDSQHEAILTVVSIYRT